MRSVFEDPFSTFWQALERNVGLVWEWSEGVASRLHTRGRGRGRGRLEPSTASQFLPIIVRPRSPLLAVSHQASAGLGISWSLAVSSLQGPRQVEFEENPHLMVTDRCAGRDAEDDRVEHELAAYPW